MPRSMARVRLAPTMRSVVRWSGRTIFIGTPIFVVALIGASAMNGSALRSGDPAALRTCQAVTPAASQYGSITGVSRAQTSTAAAVAYWQEHRGRDQNPSWFRTLPASSPVIVCLFSGQFSTPAGPPAVDGTPKAIPNALRLLVHGGDQVVFDSAGSRTGMSPETPSDLSATGR